MTGIDEGPAGWPAPGRGWREITPGVWRRRLPGWDETVGAVAGRDGLLLVDAGPSLAAGAELREQLAGGSRPPVRWLAVTHPHFDHLLGAGAFPEAELLAAAGAEPPWPAGAPAAVADGVALGLDRAEAARSGAALPAPHRLVTDALTLDLGRGRRATLTNLGPAHSGHDLVVKVTDPAGPPVVFCGDVVEESGEPQAGPDAAPARWPAALDRLLALGGERARYVPGHGAVVDAAFVRSQRAALARRFEVPDEPHRDAGT
ncbi:MBL fold metallo-hydrolase [Streptomyces sp. DSM 44915]|uniref:MBL fold metallo-hydrolase n=1 Tax=Streptomyces chisholmiae TaxID=3075540 RepID=A0ABU2K0V4_9ACTN|nr:MBL fold metallo-hydrolase [Streptomyces sp. DSM 44915]MDT0270636.1 MBL fold metallo-hydrolase [Streptomyces sp. DSM 44915]